MSKEELRAFMELRGWSQARLSAELQMSPNTISKMLEGRARIGRVVALACIGIDFVRLSTGADEAALAADMFAAELNRLKAKAKAI